jgi:hypothetical protein
VVLALESVPPLSSVRLSPKSHRTLPPPSTLLASTAHMSVPVPVTVLSVAVT